jgi:serine/threonine protein kinase
MQLVTADWRIKISDFNLSKILDNSTKSSSVAAMNPRWLPPELLDGERGTQACDIFALGVVLWELMTLQMPWENVNPWAIVGGIRQGRRLEIPNRDDIPSAVPSNALYDQYICLMQKCWAQRPGDRPKVEEVVSSLRQIAGDAGA